jgi:glycosyltransferase involved in cell wall biosynthesis
MTITTLIPVYNGSRTVRTALESVLRQTRPADEIIVLDDGSTDDTFQVLQPYRSRITLLRQTNQGVAAARNALCSHATGDLITFIDSDDIWHSRYLEVLENLVHKHPKAVAFFTGHVNFEGYGEYEWSLDPLSTPITIECLGAMDFLKRYNETTGQFGSPSYISVPRRVLLAFGNEPFRFSGVEDSYLCTTLPLLGGVVYASLPLVAYRITDESLSADRLKMFGPWVNIFCALEQRYRDTDEALKREFGRAFASRRRQYGKLLMAAGRESEAREEFRRSLGNSATPLSVAKSAWWLTASYMPRWLQPTWPSVRREWKASTAL